MTNNVLKNGYVWCRYCLSLRVWSDIGSESLCDPQRFGQGFLGCPVLMTHDNNNNILNPSSNIFRVLSFTIRIFYRLCSQDISLSQNVATTSWNMNILQFTVVGVGWNIIQFQMWTKLRLVCWRAFRSDSEPCLESCFCHSYEHTEEAWVNNKGW